ncbi:EAL and HDOD domain-containing protein [Gorillibacterium sp. sgz5001074]|uniref:EAL and HDOD domain-containing protein n=1 Tax=Gorillibacterium sp. sgz5001074 TaxID=3446695 RepID=UPI003F661170
MEVYAARQPIFDRKMNVYGYELLYRKSTNNFYEGTDDDQATAELLHNVFLVLQPHDLTGGTRAFINFSEGLLRKEIPLLLPKDQIVVEILERVQPNQDVLRACMELKMKGYLLALDDFVFQEDYLPLVQLADMIKVEYASIKNPRQMDLIRSFKRKYKVKLLAEKIETREEYRHAMELGFELFQGYFFSKPVMVQGKQVGGLKTNVLRILQELNREEPDFQAITEIIEKDLDLSYKLLKIVNSVAYGSRNPIQSIQMTLVRFGLNETKKWMYLMLLKAAETVENKELIKATLVRAKMMELMASELEHRPNGFEYYMTGLFSTMDILLQQEMKGIVEGLPLTEEVKKALLGENNSLRQLYEGILGFETGDWRRLDGLGQRYGIAWQRLMSLYVQALKWVESIEV